MIGAMRSGTTMLHELLAGVEGLCLPEMKETDFFAVPEKKIPAEKKYADYFRSPEACCGEVAPNYTKRDVFPDAAQRLHAANPAARLIYLVRDPVERAISHYQHSIHMGRELPPPSELLRSDAGQHISATSRYAWQCEVWLEKFPIDQILVVDFSDLTKKTEATAKKILHHIGVPETAAVMHSRAANSGQDMSRLPRWWGPLRRSSLGRMAREAMPRSLTDQAKKLLARKKNQTLLPVFDEETKKKLADTLKDDADRFRELTGHSFSSWSL